MIIDGEGLRLVCKDCGHKYSFVIGYGPVCPTPWLRRMKLKENPPVCPKCGSNNWKCRSLFSRLFG